MKKFFINIGVSAVSVFLFVLFLEFIFFRFILPASDIATPYYSNGIVRYQPDQQGVLRVRNEISAKFKINKNGWNSRYPEYKKEKDPDVFRIAMIGDSYIAAFQVDHTKSVAERLEQQLNDKLITVDGKSPLSGKRIEVYRFGIDGAPMSQYLHMLRQEVLQYQPDLVIVNLVHNDFNESYAFASGVFKSSFLKYQIENKTVADELQPEPYTKPWYSLIREQSATWKFLAYRQQIHFGTLRKIILGDDEDVEYWANIDVNKVEKDAENNYVVTDYTLGRIKQYCEQQGCGVIITMDADDGLIYEENTEGIKHSKSVLKLNELAIRAAEKNGVTLINLHDYFKKDYAENKTRFSFEYDGHWNEYAHNLVANILANTIQQN